MLAPLAAALAEEERYHRQLDRLAVRARGRRVLALTQGGVRFSQLLDDRDRLVRLVARAVGDATYAPSPVRLTTAHVGGKDRELARAGAIDLLVHAVLAEVIAEILEPHLSKQLFSYRVGRSSWQAVRWLAGVARTHRHERPDPRKRGLYVLRSDVKSYTDSIPVDDGALFWRDLATAVGLAASSPHFRMLVRLLRPELEAPDGTRATRARGLLFGLPTTNVLGNLYLAPLDRALEALGGAYARFGDDLVFADADAARVKSARAVLERSLAERGLVANDKKLRVFFWNGAPRASAEWPSATPSRSIVFLGAAVEFDGTVAMTTEKWRVMLSDLRGRIRRTARLARQERPKTRARLLAKIVGDAFDVHGAAPLAAAQTVGDLVSDRRQLAQLDYLVARWIAEAATDISGPRAFRSLGYWWLRRAGRLKSRVVARNRAR